MKLYLSMSVSVVVASGISICVHSESCSPAVRTPIRYIAIYMLISTNLKFQIMNKIEKKKTRKDWNKVLKALTLDGRTAGLLSCEHFVMYACKRFFIEVLIMFIH